MFKTASVNGERNGHAPLPVPAKRPAGRRKPASPPCPNCGDRFNVFQRIDRPDYLHCSACFTHFRIGEVRKLVGEWVAFLNAQGGCAEEV